jgi:hypothetical protein
VVLLKSSVFAGESKHIDNIEALIMTPLRGSSIRVTITVKSSGGVKCKCGDAELRRAVFCHRWRWKGLLESGNFQRQRLDFSTKNSPRSRT